jgi:hypothetical protein
MTAAGGGGQRVAAVSCIRPAQWLRDCAACCWQESAVQSLQVGEHRSERVGSRKLASG